MRVTAKTPEGRLRVKAVLKAREMGWTEEQLYLMASAVVQRRLRPGFGLTTCTKPELIRIVDELKLQAGETPGVHRRGHRAQGTGHRTDPTGVVTFLASQEQRHLIFALADEIFGSTESPAFAAFLVGMTGKSDARLLARSQAAKVIEALQAMQRRGWRPRAAAAQE